MKYSLTGKCGKEMNPAIFTTELDQDGWPTKRINRIKSNPNVKGKPLILETLVIRDPE